MCGVVGLIGTQDAARESFLALTILQHRGQDAAGILTYDSTGFHRVKNLGLVESVFTREGLATLTGGIAIGHARYSTAGKGDLDEVQPFLMSYPFGLALAHNGNLVNTETLARELKEKNRRHLLTRSDTEMMLNLFAEGLSSRGESGELSFDDLCAGISEVYRRAVGSYSVVTMVAGHGLLAFRDPNGIRPLIWGKKKVDSKDEFALPTGEAHMIASESAPVTFRGFEVVREIAPGEVLYIDRNGKVHSRVLEKREFRPCMFEWVYFASPESELDDVPVYGARIELGRALANQVRQEIDAGRVKPDLIVPVPETARIAAIAMAEELRIPYREVLIKNRYIKRTFILESQEKRQKAVDLKLSPVRSEIAGKRVMLVDDSIVRGTTSRKIVDLVRQAGAKEVYFVSTCPPIRKPCYYGIDFPSERELIANNRTRAEIERELGADAVIYQENEALISSIQAAANRSPAFKRPCTACLDGMYPTEIGEGKAMAERREKHRTEGPACQPRS